MIPRPRLSDMLAPERVWDYPRPPRLEPVPLTLRIELGGTTIATTDGAWRVLETSHPPVYYLPRAAFICAIEPYSGGSVCEWKGRASYWTLRQGTSIATNAAWSYPAPTPGFMPIRDHLAVYAGKVDACFVGDEQVTPQPGGFYGGWVTRNLIGPFKGGPGTMGW
jgi:uncharacterized protein (DUF427 family)